METDNGGWTLVASIHESDIKRKCTFDDRWSTYAKNIEHHKGEDIMRSTEKSNIYRINFTELTQGTRRMCNHGTWQSHRHVNWNFVVTLSPRVVRAVWSIVTCSGVTMAGLWRRFLLSPTPTLTLDVFNIPTPEILNSHTPTPAPTPNIFFTQL